MVLLVEDNDADADLMSRLLRNYGREVTVVRTLAQAIDERVSVPDVVLLDLGLPDAAGVDAVLACHARFPEIPIIVVTGFDDEHTACEAVRAGASSYLVKGAITGRELHLHLQFASVLARVITLSTRMAVLEARLGGAA